MKLATAAAAVAAVFLAAEGVCSAAVGNAGLLRPPGSQGEADFISRCIKCGKCALACPHAVINMAGASQGVSAGTPTIDARAAACKLCEDFPCVNACPTGALRNVETPAEVNMGYALIDENLCLAHEGMRCEVCYRVCPFIDQAITIDYQQREGDAIHAKFIPVVNREVCTGCGLCVERCVVSEPRVAIRIVSIAEQQKD